MPHIIPEPNRLRITHLIGTSDFANMLQFHHLPPKIRHFGGNKIMLVFQYYHLFPRQFFFSWGSLASVHPNRLVNCVLSSIFLCKHGKVTISVLWKLILTPDKVSKLHIVHNAYSTVVCQCSRNKIVSSALIVCDSISEIFIIGK